MRPGTFYLFWLPKYLYDARGFDIKAVGTLRVDSVRGGRNRLSCGRLVLEFSGAHDSSPLECARKVALGLSAAVMPSILLVPHVAVSWAIGDIQPAYFGQQSWSTLVMVLPTDLFPGQGCGLGRWDWSGFGGAMGGIVFGRSRRLPAGSWLWLRCCFQLGRHVSRRCFLVILATIPVFSRKDIGAKLELSGSLMKIKEIRTRVCRWRGKTVPLPPHFCTNPMDLLTLPRSFDGDVHFSRMAGRRNFHRRRPVGIGNAALAPHGHASR